MRSYTHSALNTVVIPEYSGKIGEDVRNFLALFKKNTLTFTDEMRCMALQKALSGTAKIWAKENIKGLIANNDWKAAKEAIVKRFGGPDHDLRHHEELSKLEFNPKKYGLLGFTEKYANLYRRAHPGAKDNEIIKNLKFKLPKNVQRSMNILDDEWVSYEDIKKFYELVDRTEVKLLQLEEEKLDEGSIATNMTKMFKDLKEDLLDKLTVVEKQAEKPAEVVAAINNVQAADQDVGKYQKASQKYNVRHEPYNKNQRGPQKRKNNDTQEPRGSSWSEFKIREYDKRFGRPPGPCQICGGHHRNKHCPLNKMDDLN